MVGLLRSGDAVIDNVLRPLAPFFRPGVAEIQAVREGEIILEELGKGWRFVRADGFTRRDWEHIVGALANWSGALYHPIEHPIVSCQLPGGHRFEGWIGAGIKSEISVSIRVARGVRLGLDDFLVPASRPGPGDAGDFGGGHAVPPPAEVMANPQALIRWVVEQGGNVLVSGGTSSGKTSLTNGLIRFVPSSDRVCSLEDTPELDLSQFRNRVEMLINRHGQSRLKYSDYFDHLMRARPDRILASEVSIRNAEAVLNLLDTGHKGFMTTVHSAGCWSVVHDTFPARVRMAGGAGDPEAYAALIRREVSLILHVERVHGKRRIVEVWLPQFEERPWRLVPSGIGG